MFQGKLHRTSLRVPRQFGGTQSFLCSARTAKGSALLVPSVGNAHVRNKQVTKEGMHRRPLRPLPSGMPLRSFEFRHRYCVVARLRLNVVCSTIFPARWWSASYLRSKGSTRGSSSYSHACSSCSLISWYSLNVYLVLLYYLLETPSGQV